MSKPVSRTVVKVLTAVTLLLLASFATTNASSTPRGSQAIRQQTPALAPEVVTVTATKTDSLFTDVNNNTLVDPGDTLQYTIVVGNSGDEDALNTLFTDITDDTEVTVVAGSLRATPIGRNDAYIVIGNTHITQAAGAGLLANDLDPDGGAITASCSPCTTTNGGAVTLNTDGSFTYNPPVGFTGPDTFTYTVTDNHSLTDTGTVTFTVTNRIWWVDSDAAGGGDGRSLTPFNTLAAAQTASGINDTVFIYNRGAAYTGGFAMQNGQKLCGHGADLATCSGLTPPTGTTFPTSSTNPTITNTAGNVVTLAQNNTIFGVTLGNSGSAANFALAGTNFGTLTIQTVTINTNNGGISLNTGTATATITSLTSGGGTNNINLTSVNGNLIISAGAATGASADAVVINGGTAAVSFGGTITNSTARAVNIQNKTGGTATFSGAINGLGTGISLTNNTGATLTFTGSLTLNTGANAAFTATGGGTLNVQTGINTATTTTGTAVNIRNMTIGASGVTFRSISANGGANGIYLDSNTGGTFTVVGTGVAGSGGTVQNMTGANGSTAGIGVYINNTGNVSLNWMQLNGFSNFAIRGITASNVALANSVVSGTSGNSAADDEGAISFTNLTGTFTFTNNTVSGGHEDNVRVVNSTGTLNATVSGSTIRDNTAVSPGNNGLWFQADGTANITASVTNSSFLRNRANGIQAITNGAGIMDITIGTLGVAGSGGTFQDNNIGVNIAHNSSGTLNFDVQETTMQPVALTTGASPININLGALGNQMSGNVRNNFLRNANSLTGPGIRIIGNGAGTLTILVNNNNIAQIGNRGIEIIARDGSNRINATVTNNTVALTDPLSADGIRADAGAVSTDTTSICANINGNNSTTVAGVFGIRVRQRFAGTTYQLQGYGGGATDMTAVQNFLSANNNGATTLADFAGGGFTSAVCPTPLEAPSFTEAGATPSDEAVETDVFPNDIPALPIFTSDTDLKDETNPKQVARSPEKVATSATLSSTFAPEAPEATTTVGPFTLPPGESTTITFRVTVEDPFPATQNPVCNQATISGSNFGDVLSDDPDVAGGSDPSCTTINIEADLSITKTDGAASAIPGTPITYTIAASNAGPNPDPTAVVADTFPAAITGVTWTCVGAGGGTCTASGSGNINETVNLPVGGSVTFTASGTISPAATGTLSNTATVATSSGITDPVPANNSATDSNTLTPQADVSITKTDGQTSDIPGTSIVYTIVASNAGPSNTPSVTVADTFPATLTGITWTCAGAGGGVCTASGSGNLNETVNLPVGGSVTFTINATIDPAATGTLSNTATAAAGGGVTDPNAGNNSATDTTTLTPEADVSITKTDGQTSDIPGTSIVYTIVASNAGPSNAPSVTVADTFPAVLTGITWTCVGAGGGTCTASGSGDLNDTANLPAGGSVTYTVNATIDAAATGTLSNTATVSSSVTDPNPANNSATDNTTLTPQADLSITKTDGQTTAVPGQSVTYTIVASNSGPSNDPSASVADTFPAILNGVTWTCVGAGGGTCTAAGSGNINDTVNLPAGGSVTYTASGTISAAATGTLANTATVSSSVTDPNAGNNSATDTDTLTPQADVSITKTDGQTSDIPGTSIVYTIVASNAGPSNASSVTVADTFPATLTGVTWTCVGAGGATCTASGSGNINESVNLPAGGSVIFTANATIDAAATGTLSNTATATVGGGVTDPNPANNSATDTTTLTPQADLSITKTDGLSVAVPGQATTYTITVSNAGPSSALSASVADTFPAALTGVTWTCSGAGGGTCTAVGSGNIADTVNLPAGGSLTYIANATIDGGASGTLTNTATVAAPGGVTDPNPGNNSATDSTSLDAPPEITDLTVTPGTINENGSVNLSVTFTDPNTQEAHEVVINWGDGSADTVINLPIGTLTTSASHQYLDDNPTGTPSDTYTVTVTVNEADGGTDSDTAVVTVNNIAPTLTAVNATNANENGSVTLSGSISDPGTQDTFTLVVDWGDGNSDTYNYPAGATSFSETHQYLDDDPTGTPADQYTISLTLTDDDTGSDTDSVTTTISNVAPTLSNVAVTANVDEGTNTLTLTGSIADPGTPDTFSLAVDWADGNVETVNYPAGTTAFTLTHTYQDDALIALRVPEADFTIDVTLTDDDTGSDSDSVTVTVDNVAPTLSGVSISSPVDEGSAATLTGSISDPSPNDTFSLLVDWGDGNMETFSYGAGSTSFSETHIYVDDDPTGTPSDVYTATLTLTDDNGGSDTGSTAVTVNNVAPTLSSVSASDLVENDVTSLTFTINDPGTADTFSLEISWGDGLTETFTYASAGVYTETHQYLDDDPTGTPADSYTIDLTLTDDDTGSDTDGTVIIVNNAAPTLDNLTATAVSENGFTTLSGDITDPGTLDTFTVVVDWGDGITETFSYGTGTTSFSETHQYLDDDPTGTPSDDYTISVTVTDDDTGVGSDTAVLAVSNVAPDLFNVAATPLQIDENNSITVTGQISDVGTLDSFDLSIDWGDGNSEGFTFPAGTTSFLATHTYEDDGLRALLADFDINLTLTDDDTGSDSETITVQVDNVAPTLDNVTISDPINEGDTATLTGSIIEVSPADSFTLTVAWGDGNVDSFAYGAGTTGFSESHTYADDDPTATPFDVYTATLTLVDDNGGTAVHITTLTVHNVAPVVDAGADMAVNTGTAVTFNGSFSDIGIEDTHAIEWDFGDGNTASGTLTPTHTYGAAGVYTATLTVTDDDTGVASDQVVVTVTGSTIFLPIILNNSGAAAGPDLVVSSLTAVGSNIELVVTNQGSTAVSDDFWVDVYIDPDPVPTMVNQTWQLVAGQGLVWGVSNVTLNPGQSLTLTINGDHYRADLSDFTGPLPTGTPVYAQVDAANTTTTYGNVLENHESSGGVYNNIIGTMAQ